MKADKELEIATAVKDAVKDIVRESGQVVFAMGMTHADSDFVLTCGFRHPISGNIRESIGEAFTPVIRAFYDRFKNTDSIQNLIISVRVPHRYIDGYKKWTPLVSFEFSKDESKSIIWKRFDPKTLLRFSENVNWDGLQEQLKKDLNQMRDHIGSKKRIVI